MPKLYRKTLLDAPLEAVWAFHEDTQHGLRTLSPPEADVQVTKADPGAVGAEVVIRAKGPLGIGRIKWVAKYTQWQPPHGEVPYRKAWFQDVQEQGPFKSWTHTHRFEETVDEGRSKVWAIDEVVYVPPLGPIGWIGDKLVIKHVLRQMFDYRHKKLREVLSRRPAKDTGDD